MWHRAEKNGVDPAKAVMIASTVSSKILQTMSKEEGFVFEETLTGFKWMANRSLQLKEQGYHILFAFEGHLTSVEIDLFTIIYHLVD